MAFPIHKSWNDAKLSWMPQQNAAAVGARAAKETRPHEFFMTQRRRREESKRARVRQIRIKLFLSASGRVSCVCDCVIRSLLPLPHRSLSPQGLIFNVSKSCWSVQNQLMSNTFCKELLQIWYALRLSFWYKIRNNFAIFPNTQLCFSAYLISLYNSTRSSLLTIKIIYKYLLFVNNNELIF